MQKHGAVKPLIRVATILISGFLIGLFAVSSSSAQSFAADELIRQQERERQLRLQQEQAPDVRLQAPSTSTIIRLPENESPCFLIERIALVGDAADRFQFALRSVIEGEDSPIGKCLGANGINLVLTRVQNAVVVKGFVTTRVLASPQDIQTGDLTLTVIPGRVRNIRFAPNADPRGTKWNAVPIQSGDILNLRDIEQGLENFKRVPTVAADIKIEAAEGEGAQPGQSDLTPHYSADYEVSNWYVSRHPTSHFVSHLVAALAAEEGRHVLHDTLYSFYPHAGEVEKRYLHSIKEIRDLLENAFHIRTSEISVLDARLETLLAEKRKSERVVT